MIGYSFVPARPGPGAARGAAGVAHPAARRRGRRRRWVIERTMSWLTGYRRLNHRYEREPGNYLAFLGLASALCCYKRFLKRTM
ncbi:transposase [Streptomyces sp. MK7]|uniref:transposase n=1 Tax=Streptomyces sp. MK7 TaxID=3067635 RepID=UPI0037D9D329